MGNCQAIDTATLVIQHPCGKIDKMYWPVSANEVMKSNPGHYVALLISTTLCPPSNNNPKCPDKTNNNGGSGGNSSSSSVRLTRIKLLRPTDTLVLGQVYRLITSQDVMKGLLAKKQSKLKKTQQPESAEKSRRSETEKKDNQVVKHDRNRARTTAAAASKIWQPSLQSISEAAS